MAQAADLTREVVGHEVTAFGFGFYKPEEVLKLAKVKITESQSFDALGTPVPNGLFDPRMGPMERFSSCITCGLPEHECPGHMGAIELAAPCYNPLTFQLMLKLLSRTCLQCHRLRLPKEKLRNMRMRLELIAQGRLLEASQLVSKQGASVLARIEKSEDGEDIASSDSDDSDDSDDDSSSSSDDSDSSGSDADDEKKMDDDENEVRSVNWSTATLGSMQQARKNILRDLLRCPVPQKCPHCSEPARTLRNHKTLKLFKRKQRAAMAGRSKRSDEFEQAKDRTADQLMLPNETRVHVQEMWLAEGELLRLLFARPARKLLATASEADEEENPLENMFFLSILAVPPVRYRPASQIGDRTVEHAQNTYFREILQLNEELMSMQRRMQDKAKDGATPQSSTLHARFVSTWLDLQEQVNCLIDSSKSTKGLSADKLTPGIRQALEKKQGLFRQNMMGKRVNFAARSVVNPGLWIHADEVGVPEPFAKKLSYPQPVTAHNMAEMRQRVINGPSQHPGANFVQDEMGRQVSLDGKSRKERVAIADALLSVQSSVARGNRQKVVGRHLHDGDVVLLNRQPTLHRASIMAHRVRVLRGANVIRLHYTNCNSYNADFDGDEINMHFPQNELARAEGYHIAATKHQYVGAKDGEPLRNLMQDHVVAGVSLTRRDRFLTKMQYMHLVNACLAALDQGDRRVTMEPPTIWVPEPLWTGKQLITTLLNLLSERYGRSSEGVVSTVTMKGKAKTDPSIWNTVNREKTEEGVIIVRQNDFLTGVIDKGTIGTASFGLVHAVNECLGTSASSDLITALGHMLTTHMYARGHTASIDDLLLTTGTEQKRHEHIVQSQRLGVDVAAKFTDTEQEVLRSAADRNESEFRARLALKARLCEDPNGEQGMDGAMKGRLNPITSGIIADALPFGQRKTFPDNNFTLMIGTGAKGSQVNMSQIACLLGQQELEGHRVPRMASGKTLPSFAPYDPSARAGGYITDRFLSGIRPQEYFFHCMAGREGLVDTAVKTANSGYLQRCLIKHLETLSMQYDGTVRDNDGNVLQFVFGNDGQDVQQAPYMRKFDFLVENINAVRHRLSGGEGQQGIERIIKTVDTKTAGLWKQQAEKAQKRQAQVEKALRKNKRVEKSRLPPAQFLDPMLAHLPPQSKLGVVSESFDSALEEWIAEQLQKSQSDEVRPGVLADEFRRLMHLRWLKNLCPPGEAVGVVAAQSLGEPSTQMTLNTFHLAGHGGANVTLGIPRLREIIMSASQDIKTPSMAVSFLSRAQEQQRAQAEDLKASLGKVMLKDILHSIEVHEKVSFGEGSVGRRVYTVALVFVKNMPVSPTWSAIKKALETKFIKFLCRLVSKAPSVAEGASALLKTAKAKTSSRKKSESPKDEDDVDSDNDDEREEIDHSEDEDEEESESESEMQDDEADEIATVGDEDPHDVTDVSTVGGYDSDNERTDIRSAMTDEPRDSKKTAEPAVSRRAAKLAFSHPLLSGVYYTRKQRKNQHDRCEVALSLPLSAGKVLMASLAERAAERVAVQSTRGISKGYVVTSEPRFPRSGAKQEVLLQTDGVNFDVMWKHADVIDVNRIHTNDIGAILHTYGVEAANASIQHEIASVFGVYGIEVDPRHLSLVADYMTFEGGFRPFNRIGLSNNVSPLLKITYETSAQFLVNACVTGDVDNMETPSARIIGGHLARTGTGAFELLQPLEMRNVSDDSDFEVNWWSIPF
ncbi:MAG: hypothetical protein MHM6MM_002472 [Cercozoa sp. M6MM]